jgi:ParB-like chromosome segregation protein Spo0J
MKESIQDKGLLEPLVVDRRTMRIISGHRRWHALKELGIGTCAVRYEDYDTEDETLAALLAHNSQRKKTTGEIAAEYVVCRELERNAAKERMRAGGRIGGKGVTKSATPCTETGTKKTRAVNLASARVGWSRAQGLRFDYILAHAPNLAEKVIADQMSIAKAYRLAHQNPQADRGQSTPQQQSQSLTDRASGDTDPTAVDSTEAKYLEANDVNASVAELIAHLNAAKEAHDRVELLLANKGSEVLIDQLLVGEVVAAIDALISTRDYFEALPVPGTDQQPTSHEAGDPVVDVPAWQESPLEVPDPVDYRRPAVSRPAIRHSLKPTLTNR